MLPWWEALDKQQRWLVGSHIVNTRHRATELHVPMSDAQRAFVERCVVPDRWERVPVPLRSQRNARSSSGEVGADSSPQEVVERVTRPIEIRITHDGEPLP
jgi:hypothetical protein